MAMMIVLGRHNDDNGTQLEALTRSLLEHRGYINVVSNYVSSGGEEIDVRASFPVPSVAAAAAVGLVCECKAHRAPLSMPDWLKFLGKVFTEDLRTGVSTHAWLIALGGVNGNVAGNFDDVRRRRTNIDVIHGDRLLSDVRDVFQLCDVDTVMRSVAAYTDREVRASDVVYYEGAAYWAVTLAGDGVALLDRTGVPVSGDAFVTLQPMLNEALPGATLDLRQEAAARERALLTEKLIIAELMLANGRIACADVGRNANVSRDDLHLAVSALRARGWVADDYDDAIRLMLDGNVPPDGVPAAEDAHHERLAVIDRFLLTGPVSDTVVGALWSTYHAAHADDGYVRHLLANHGNVTLDEDEIQEVEQIIARSPSALQWLLEPDPLFAGTESQFAAEASDEFRKRLREAVLPVRRSHLFLNLYQRLARDCKSVALRPRFHDQLHVREVQILSRISIKTDTCVLLSREVNDRLALGTLQEGSSGLMEPLTS